MSEHEHARKIFAKFKIDRSGQGLMNGLVISEDFASISAWDGTKEEKGKQRAASDKTESNVFLTVSKTFVRSVGVYQNSVPFIMSTVPLIGQIMDDRQLRGFAKKHGNCLETGEFEVYEFPAESFFRPRKLLDRTMSVKTGIEAIPRLFLLGLISDYDAFFSDLLRAIFLTKPEMLSASEKNLSFKDLLKLDSVEAAREFIIEREIESVIRSSHADQIKWLENKLNIALTKDLKIWPDFIELCERRNLFTHTNGVVSSQYCNVCREHKVEVSVNVGERLHVDSRYFRKAISVIFEMGVKLTQVIWRKLLPNEVDDAASNLNDIAYDLISKRGYKAAGRLLYFGLEVMKKHGSDATKKVMIVNYANAIKLGGDKERALSIINKEDWSAATDNYKICVAAIKDDVPTVINLMSKVVEAGLMDLTNLREWPVFEKARADDQFVEAFETKFGEKLLSDKEAATRPDTEDDKQDASSAHFFENDEDKTLH